MKKIVLKLGTGILSAGHGNIHQARLQNLAQGISTLRKIGVEVIIVSSGAVGLGMGKLGYKTRPDELAELRACASIGQCLLMNAWSKALDEVGMIPGQVLLTREDFNQQSRSEKVKETLLTLLERQVVPIVNENDSVSDEEIKFGDNDVLSALLASLSEADMLVILSTAPGLMTHKDNGKLVPFIAEITPAIEQMAQGTNSPTAVGGMITKIDAAKVATKSGCAVFIGSGEQPANLTEIFEGKAIGTFFPPSGLNLKDRKRWLAFFPKPQGSLIVSHACYKNIIEKGSSLLASGLCLVEGPFDKNDVVSIKTEEGQAFAQGVSRFNSTELKSLQGLSKEESMALSESDKQTEIINCDHLAPTSCSIAE
jgi:glutamate 5-kinase